MLQRVQGPVTEPNLKLREITLSVDRHTIAKRIWRGVAEDGVEFGFELTAPLKHGDTVFENSEGRYVIYQHPEALLEISLNMAPSAAAAIAWAIGNLHLELSAEPTRLLVPDESAVQQLLGRLKVPFKQTNAIFRPGRFARGDLPQHEFGPSHRH